MGKLIVFDVDGTLVDSQEAILAAMAHAFGVAGITMPPRAEVLGIVGLSLPQAMARLCPDLGGEAHGRLVDLYKAGYLARRQAGGGEAESPFFPGALVALDRFAAEGHALAIATGKARRGLDHMIATHGLEGRFAATQTADEAPSKPAPEMVLNCLAATGHAPGDCVVVGDTEFDMAMARAAGARAVGVTWGYHPRARLLAGGAEALVESFEALDAALAAIWAGEAAR